MYCVYPVSSSWTATDANGDALTLTAAVLPSWLSFDGVTGVLSGTPSNNDAGMHNVTLRVSDGTANVDQTFTVTVSSVLSPADIASSSGGGSIDLLLILLLGGLLIGASSRLKSAYMQLYRHLLL